MVGEREWLDLIGRHSTNKRKGSLMNEIIKKKRGHEVAIGYI
jgi:hypothetical protein